MIHTLPKAKTTQKRVRVGRGMSSKGGHTTGRGHKGQKSRSGYSRPRPGFEGGQMPLARRLPKLKGFSRGFKLAGVKHIELRLSSVAESVAGNTVNTESLLSAGLLKESSKKVSVKVLFDKPITKKLSFEGIQLSASAKAAVEKAGGQVA